VYYLWHDVFTLYGMGDGSPLSLIMAMMCDHFLLAVTTAIDL
jgi:hypothetical protein